MWRPLRHVCPLHPQWQYTTPGQLALSMAGGKALLPYVYHERQNEGSMLCAQHALNNVLQGHFFDATQLGQIAAELAAYEADSLDLQPDSSDLGSRHMDDTGYFSVEVLYRAFQTWDMHLERWRPHERFKMRYDHPENEFAFVLNLGSHWFVIRGFGTRSRSWFNLNSFLSEPQWVGNAYLGSLLQSQEGYSVFVLELADGVKPPENIADDIADARGSDTEHVASSAPAHDEDDDLQRALQASLAEQNGGPPGDTGGLSAPGPSGSDFSTPTRRRRARQPNSDSEEESDAHVDAIAPQRHRLRNSAQDTDDRPARQLFDLPPSGRRRRGRRSVQNAEDDSIEILRQLSGGRDTEEDRERLGLSAEQELPVQHSPFLHPVASPFFQDDEIEVMDESSSEPEITHVQSRSEPPPAPPATQHEDDDEQLQAVLAASLGQPYTLSEETKQRAQRAFEARQPSEEAPVPADVERIRRMREQGNTSQFVEEPESQPAAAPAKPSSDSEDSSSEPEEQQLSAEEIRQRRLARFG